MAEAKKIVLPKGTYRQSLIQKNPAELDTRNLDITPLQDFGTMGFSDHTVELSQWRLRVTGAVTHPLELTFEQVAALPSIERNVLLICPGFFANHGQWKGLSINELLKRAKPHTEVTQVTIGGPEGSFQRVNNFPLAHVATNQVFLAYEVNGRRLPMQHGYPLRVVAEGYYGFDWIKYVDTLTVDAVASEGS